tara:strand:- start:1259 stop:2521 length:1263 start_codon:yes stop_codon:yes gene_type:complete
MSVAFDSNVNIICEIAFDSEPFAETQTFTDVSQYVRSFSTTRGRSNELADFVSGTLSVSLSNTDNRFNPTQTTHYYDSANATTKIQPLKRIRLRAEYDSSTYDIFEGFLNTIPVKFVAGGVDSIVTFTANDAFKIFQSANLDAVGWRLGKGGFAELGQTTRLSYEDVQELTSDRITRILNSLGFPTNRRDIQTGVNQVQSQQITDNVLTALRENELADNGQLFIGKDGKVVFRNRDYRLSNANATTVQATFSNTGSDLPYQNVSLSFDDNEIVNVYEWTREGGVKQEVSDADSVLKYTPKENTQTTINVNDADVLSLIEQKIATTSLPIVRVDNLTINARDDVNLWQHVLGRQFGDRIKVVVQNPNATTFTDELWIESIKHNVNASNQTWSFTLTLSPAGSSAWVLGQAKLGEGTRFVYS